MEPERINTMNRFFTLLLAASCLTAIGQVAVDPASIPSITRIAYIWYPENLTKNLFKDSEKDVGLQVHKKSFDGSASITQCEASFQSGRLDGKTIWYYPSGNLSQVQFFDADVRVKNWQMFRDDEGNTLQFSENFDSDSRIQKWYDTRGNLEETRELAPASQKTISNKENSFREWHEGFQAFFANYNTGCNVTDWLVESGEKKVHGSWDESRKFAEVLVSLSNYCFKASGDHFTWISAGLGLQIREVASTVELVNGDVFVMHNFEYSRSLNPQEKTELVSSKARTKDFMFKELYRGEPYHFTSEFQVGVGFRYTDARGHGPLVRQILFSHDDFVKGTTK